MKTLSARYHQAHKEAKWALGLALAYFFWWYGSAYAFAPDPAQTSLPELYWGFPLWFLLACIIGPVIFTLLCALMVKYLYQDMPLTVDEDTPDV
ncbi:YhdT family protein [Photobacterium sp. MCCC 1A19761]|uniref:YhdT family protein n=1 Tax=Photobacterium sp. MCCC 1A19761 TaxID=3115000 RepID=UPI00307F1ED3